MIKLFYFLILISLQAFACDEIKNQLNPQLKKKLGDYDKFIVSLQSEKDPIKAINKRIRTHGILLAAYINEKLVKNYPSSFYDESITGARKLFLKNMKLPPGLSNDIIYEVATLDSPKALRSWQIPSNHNFLGIRGNEIILRAYLGTPCSNFRRDVLLAVSSNGRFRAIPDIKIPEPKYNLNCAGVKTLYQGSEYGACLQFQEIKSKKKRIIVFQQPMS
jgi:hypothetical protein